jgi:hypothetical protein
MAIGEPRWCSVSSRDTSNTIVYVPIAAAAQVQGEARARIIYSPNSRVERVEPVSGVPMLLEPLAGQLSNWTVRSNASGHELCQTLVIATFMLRKPSRSWTRKQKVKFTTGPNAIHVLISRPRPEIETDTSSPALKGS